MPLADEEIRAVIARAEEIERAGAIETSQADVEAVIQAAEAVGISRAAVERALRERHGVPGRPPVKGDLVFAKSADGKFYVAEVVSVDAEDFRVRYLRGGEHAVQISELRPCSLLPGERVVCHWPAWGPWTCAVVSYDAANRRVTLSDGWSQTRTVPIENVWLNAPRGAALLGWSKVKIHAALLGAGATMGALIGSALTMFFLR